MADGIQGYSVNSNKGVYGYNNAQNQRLKPNVDRDVQYFDPHNPNAYNYSLAYINARSDEKPQFMKAYEEKPQDRNIYFMS